MKESIQILIVEDELIAAEFLTLFLKKEGYNVIGVCESGEDAIQMAQKYKPDVIFMDIFLKGTLNGCESALKIVSNLPHTKIIFLTAYSDDEMIQYAMDVGAINYLLKPYNEAQILVALNLALGKQSIPQKALLDRLHLAYGYVYDFSQKKFLKDHNEVNLGGKGLAVIKYLCEHYQQVVSYTELSQYIYGEEKNSSTLRALIFRIKRKLECDIIENVSGLGYKIKLQER